MGGEHHGESAGGGRLPLWTVKLLAALLMAAVCAAGCVFPVVVAAQAQKPGSQQQHKRSKYFLLQALLSLINCFAAGAFLGLAMIHLLPEAVMQLQRDGYMLVIRTGGNGDEPGITQTYNIAYVLAAVGFTAMLAVEQFLAGGHAHCHRDVPLPVEGQRSKHTAARALPAFVDLSRCRSSVEPPGLLQHSSHHHVQHHLVCTSANYCPGCDDCAEAATAAPAAGGDAAGAAAAGGAVNRACQLVAAYEGSEARVAKSPLLRIHQEDHGCGLVEAEKKQRVLQLASVSPEHLQAEDNYGLFKEEGPRTHSQETANTSTGCSDSIHEKRRALSSHSKKRHVTGGARGAQTHLQKEEESVVVTIYTVEPPANSSTGSGVKPSQLTNCADNAAFPAQEGKAETECLQPQKDSRWVTGAASAEGDVEMPHGVGLVKPNVVVTATPISDVSAAETSENTKRGAATRGRRIIQSLLGIPVRHELAKSVSSNSSFRNGGHASESTVLKNRSSSRSESEWEHRGADTVHGNGSKNSCCNSNSHVTDSQISTEQNEGQRRGSTPVGAAATPGDTSGSRLAAVTDKCGCKNFEDAAPVTACCCSGCCKKCGDHSHDPESSSRVHSGSMGADVQGGDSAVEQQRGTLNGSWLRVGGTRRGCSVGHKLDEGNDEECGDNRKEGTEADFHVVSISSPPATIHSIDPLSPRSNSAGCCEYSKRGETERILESGLSKKHSVHLQRQQQRLLGEAQHSHAKPRATVANSDDGKEHHPHSRRGGLRTRALSWIKHFDAAKWSLTVALGVHALFEGVILGTTMKSEDVWIAALAILGHKAAEGVALSSTLLRLHMTRPHFLSVLGLFVLASPLGVFLGAVATMGGTGVCGVFNALAVGAVLYATNEMLSEFAGRCSRVRRVLKLLAFALGLGMLFGLDLLHAPVCRHHHHHHGEH